MKELTIAAAPDVDTPGVGHRRETGDAASSGTASAASPLEDALTDLKPLSHALSGQSRAPEPGAKCGAPELGALRARIFSAIRDGNFVLLQSLLPGYSAMLETALADSAADLDALRRVEADHVTFFEQLKATLVTNRIQTRLELERVNASQRYEARTPVESEGGWQG